MSVETVRRIAFMAAVACVSLLVAGMLLGQETTTPSKSSKAGATSTMTDAHFAREAASGGMAEVKLGQLAQDKGSNQAVKDFGKKMVEDHSAANDKLKSVASDQKIKLPDAMSKADQATYDRLSALSGDAFDKAYARDMVNDHVKDIAAFKREAADGKNDAVKSFASDTLPTLQMHLKMARQMATVVGASTGAKHTTSAKTTQ